MPLQRRRILSDNTPNLTERATVPAATSLPLARRNRRKRRTGELVAAVAKLDTTTDPEARRQLAEFVQSLYEAQDIGNPIALFATCYLGHPYLDHVMCLDGSILEHFKHNQRPSFEYDERLSQALEPARALARSGAYAYIELFDDGSVVPVRETGDPVA